MAKAKSLPLKPIGGNILVKPLGQEETTPSGLVISATAQEEKPQQGEVIGLGTGRLDKDGNSLPWNVKVGDKVFFKKYSPDELELDGETYLVMDEGDILGVLVQ
jgi:chaperonin GroES